MPLRDPLKTELLFRAQMTPPLQLHTAVEVQEKSAPLIEGDRCLFLWYFDRPVVICRRLFGKSRPATPGA